MSGARFVIVDPSMVALFGQVDRIARNPISVLILGETGVGKEVLAEEIHHRSGRKGRFVPLNCAALPETLLESELFGHEKGAFTGAVGSKSGLFEVADHGTLFLDEIGDLPLAMQVKLLRVLEERKVLRVGGLSPRSVDVRFIAATHHDVEQEAGGGHFRSDLYYRLNGITLTVPPLRQRRADIAPLAQRFLLGACHALQRETLPRISTQALDLLLSYAWPGNIRELRNAIERAVLLCDGDELLPSHLPPQIADPRPPLPPRPALAGGASGTAPALRGGASPEHIEGIERGRVVEALARCGGNQTQAAELLGISRRTLVTRIGMYDLPRPRRR